MEKKLERTITNWVINNPDATVHEIMEEFGIEYPEALMILTIVDELSFDEDEWNIIQLMAFMLFVARILKTS